MGKFFIFLIFLVCANETLLARAPIGVLRVVK